MRLGAALTLVGLGIGGTTLAVLGCGDSESSSSSSSGGGDQAGKVPPAPEGDPAAAGAERTFALDQLQLGEATRSGQKDPNAWKAFGYNLDKRITKVTDKNSPDLAHVCKLVKGAEPKVHDDGDEGTDNAFGSQILKLLDSFTQTPSKTITDSMRAGDFTILLKLKGLDDSDTQTNTGLSGTLLVGGKFGDSAPKFEKTEEWPHFADPQVAIDGAYIKNGVFVNGQGGSSVRLSLSIGGQQLSLTINRAVITFKHAGSTLADGTVAGVIKTSELLEGIGEVAGRFSTQLCAGSVVDNIKSEIMKASDMLYDGTVDPNKECDAISVGIGFTAKEISKPGPVVEPGPPPADPCAGGGQQDGG